MKFMTVDIECISPHPTSTTDLVVTPTSAGLVTKDDVLVHEQTIVAISCLAIDTQAKTPVARTLDLSLKDMTEAEVLKAFSDMVNILNPTLPAALDYDFVTYGGNRYDLPVLLYRMFHYGMEAAWLLEPKDIRYKFSTKGHMDLAEYMSNYSRFPPMSAVAKLMGLPGKLDGLDGSHVGEMVAAGQWEELTGYCALDVVQETLIRLRIEYTRGLLGVNRYNEVAAAVIRSALNGPHKKILKCLSSCDVFIA